MQSYDVIVAGLGPGGSSAAYELARRGFRVLALEKYRLPRYKPCGGCLSAKILSILDTDLSEVIEETITRVIVSFRGQSDIVVESPEPVAYMVMRDRFDFFLARRAAESGAVIRDGEPVVRIIREKEGYRVQTGKGEYWCRYYIGADGVNGISARELGFGPRKQLAVALEGEAKIVHHSLDALQHTVRLDIGDVPQGYGWLFPKKDHWSLGVGTISSPKTHPKELYRTFVAHQGLESGIEEEQRRGYRIPLFSSRKSRIASGHALLVGDAAALVDPFLGEGIYYAIRSGQIAAEVIEQANGRRIDLYQKRIADEFYPEFEAALHIARFGYQFPKLGFMLFKLHPEYAKAFLDILQGSLSYRDFWNSIQHAAGYGIFEFLSLLRKDGKSASRTYDRIASQYDAWRFLWQETLAREPTEFFYELVSSHLKPGQRILDAGTGTGEVIRELLKACDRLQIVGVDQSAGMLHQAQARLTHPGVRFQRADFHSLPFPDKSFDMVVCCWSLESSRDPKKAVTEFLRVIRDDGFVIYLFASQPGGLRRFYTLIAEKLIASKMDWHFIRKNERPYHQCKHSLIRTFADGLFTVVVLRKCCTVSDEIAPCRLPAAWKFAT